MLLKNINILNPCRWGRRYIWFNYFSILQQRDNLIKILSKHLKIEETEANYLVIKHPLITKLNEAKIQNLINTVCNIGYLRKDILDNPSLFGILPVTIKFRYEVLQECAIENISIKDILSYLSLVKQNTIGDLIKSNKILHYVNVENRLASYMTQWPTSLTASVSGDVHELNLYSLRLKIIQRYLELLLDLTCEEFYRGIQTYPTIKHRPLKVINETLQILQSQVMISTHKLKNNLYLVHVDPDNLRNIINNFRSIGGIDIKEIIRMHPKIATKRYETLVEIRNVIREFGITDEAQIRCFDIYTLAPSTIKERLEKAKSIPEFNTFFYHPRFLKIIHYNTIAVKRLNKLYGNNKKCLSLNVLSGSSDRYELFEKSPGDRLGKGKDLIFCIQQSLGKKFKSQDIRSALRKHPFWINIPLVQVKFVHKNLAKHFSDEEIFHNCPILLYPWNKIKTILDLFKKHSHKNTLFCDYIDLDKLSQSQKLSLVIYMLERKHYFSGNGVWSEEKIKNSNLRLPEENKVYLSN